MRNLVKYFTILFICVLFIKPSYAVTNMNDVIEIIKKHDVETYQILQKNNIKIYYADPLKISNVSNNKEINFSNNFYINSKYNESNPYAIAAVIANFAVKADIQITKPSLSKTDASYYAYVKEAKMWEKYKTLKSFESYEDDLLEEREDRILNEVNKAH